MSYVTRLLDAVKTVDRPVVADLFPIVDDELRQLAPAWMANETLGQTLQHKTLVHAAYLRRLGPIDDACQECRGHLFTAEEAKRRILVETVRRKRTENHGGHGQSVELDEFPLVIADDQLPVQDPDANCVSSQSCRSKLVLLHSASPGQPHSVASDMHGWLSGPFHK